MTAVDALRTLFKALALDREDAGLIADYGMIGLHAIRAARAALAEKGESELLAALDEVIGWIDSWDPNFTQDEEWAKTDQKVRAILAKHAKE